MDNQLIDSNYWSGHLSDFRVWVVFCVKKAVQPYCANITYRQ